MKHRKVGILDLQSNYKLKENLKKEGTVQNRAPKYVHKYPSSISWLQNSTRAPEESDIWEAKELSDKILLAA